VDEDTHVVSAALVPHDDEEDEAEQIEE
jgi:hypothetical protein